MTVRLISRYFLILAISITASCSDADHLTLAKHGESLYSIVISSGADPSIQKASSEFQEYFERVSGARLPIKSDKEAASDFEIIIGTNHRLDGTGFEKKIAALDQDGFIIKTLEKKLVIAGKPGMGTLYGVNTFLEDYLGCRKYSADFTLIPTKETVVLKQIEVVQNPAFTYRELHFPDPINNEDYRNWHKLDRKEGENEWGMFVHTFDDLVPAEKYFKDHPEYFSFLNVQRIPDGQLCLSNPDVLSLVIAGLEQRMKEKPHAKYWSVSQNDTYKACECDGCKKLYRDYGGYSGAMIWFVNQVAAEFTDKINSTLAYQYTRSAPKNIKPAKNVNIMFCSIECNRSRSLATDSLSASFRKDCEDWCELTDNIFMWDYVVQFRNMVSPFPNLRVLQPNLQYFRDKGMKMMFQQGTGGNVSEFYELRQYLIAKLLWDPDADIEALMNDFLSGFYGPAAPFIGKYIGRMHDALSLSGGNLGIYGYPYDGMQTYLTSALIVEYEMLFAQAEDAVRDQPENLRRVKHARLPLDFAILDISLRNVNDNLTYFRKIDGNWSIRKEMLEKLDNLTRDAKAAGITRYWEHGNAPDEYKETVLNYTRRSFQENFALFMPVEMETSFSEKYPVGGGRALTDGLRGINDYHFNWLGFEGPDMVAVIDLEASREIASIETSFLQDIQSWIFMPESVEYSVSEDGKNFRALGAVNSQTAPKQAGAIVEDFVLQFDPVKARYIKVIGKNRGTCPAWHPGYGYPAWIFCDEVVVK